MSKKEITVKSSVTVKKSSDFNNVIYKATAGRSQAEIIEENTIDTYDERDKKEEN